VGCAGHSGVNDIVVERAGHSGVTDVRGDVMLVQDLPESRLYKLDLLGAGSEAYRCIVLYSRQKRKNRNIPPF